MVVVSLFDGMSLGKLAFDILNVPVIEYYASEIDKPAIKVSKVNHHDVKHMGDVMNWRNWDIDWSKVDMVMAGSPCQGFSAAGKHGGTKVTINGVVKVIRTVEEYKITKLIPHVEYHSESYLFWEFVLILQHVKSFNPKVKFMLENVGMSESNLNMISESLNVRPININSALVSPQLRNRYYWCNWVNVSPEDRNIKYQSILESGRAKVDKAFALTASYYKGGGEATRQRNFKKSQRPIVWITDNITRHCTPLGCERLQTLPEGYTGSVSQTQRYKMIGNGWTLEVILHLFKCMLFDSLLTGSDYAVD